MEGISERLLLEEAKRVGLRLIQFDQDSHPCAMGDSLDDVGGDCIHFHLERMAQNNYWLGIDLADGSRLRFWIGHPNQRARINAYLEIEEADEEESGAKAAQNLSGK
jgi:hypothetical protein